MTLAGKVLVVIAAVVVLGTAGPWLMMHIGSHGSLQPTTG